MGTIANALHQPLDITKLEPECWKGAAEQPNISMPISHTTHKVESHQHNSITPLPFKECIQVSLELLSA